MEKIKEEWKKMRQNGKKIEDELQPHWGIIVA